MKMGRCIAPRTWNSSLLIVVLLYSNYTVFFNHVLVNGLSSSSSPMPSPDGGKPSQFNSSWKNVKIDPPDFFDKDIDTVVGEAGDAVEKVLNLEVCEFEDQDNSHNVLMPQNRGRIGIEVDGARFLLSSEMKKDFLMKAYTERLAVERVISTEKKSSKVPTHNVSPNYDSLELEVDLFNDLSQVRPSSQVIDRDMRMEDLGMRIFTLKLASKLSRLEGSKKQRRRVTIFFRNIQLALMASRELQLLKDQNNSPTFQSISVFCIKDDLPEDFFCERDLLGVRERRKKLLTGYVNGDNGIAIIVQPRISELPDVQRVTMSSATAFVPLLLVSPRMENPIETESLELAGSYGGSEPSRHPWYLNDFLPPVFAWIVDKTPKGRQYNIAMTRSVKDKDQAWHLFHATASQNNFQDFDKNISESANYSKYQYFASIPSSTGRPNHELIETLYNDWRIRLKNRGKVGE